MHINAGEISKIIKEQIQNYEQRVDATETGTVLSVGDGIARVYGVQNAMSMELAKVTLLGRVEDGNQPGVNYSNLLNGIYTTPNNAYPVKNPNGTTRYLEEVTSINDGG